MSNEVLMKRLTLPDVIIASRSHEISLSALFVDLRWVDLEVVGHSLSSLGSDVWTAEQEQSNRRAVSK